MDAGALLAGIGAVIAAGAGVIILVRELRRRDRKQSLKEIADLEAALHSRQRTVLSLRQYAFQLGELLADRGVEPPPPPHETPEPADAGGGGVLRDQWDTHVRGRLRRGGGSDDDRITE